MLLPIVIRELRVSARNKATHRLRLLFAVSAVTLGGSIGLLSLAGSGFAGSQLGIWIFGALKWIAFVLACAAGVFLTSDCLSEEKREGTLGLLFLTDLRGHDVVLGKLLATSLRTFYSLLAIFPVMALSFVMGGVAADDFQHTLLSLCNALFFSLALGMVISVMSRDPHRAMTGTLAAMVVFLFAVPGLDSLLLAGNGGVARFGLLSPAYAFTHTSGYRASDFWWSLGLVQLAGWCFLGIASWLAPKTWHEKGFRLGLRAGWPSRLFGSAGAERGGRELREKSPVCWIIARDRWAASIARMALLLVVGVFALSLAAFWQGPAQMAFAAATPAAMTQTTTVVSTNGNTTNVVYTVHSASWAGGVSKSNLYQFASGCASALALALEFWLAAHVARFYVDGKRSGFLELLLVTPIRPAEIIAGHWLALRRLFFAPVTAQLFLTLACGVIQVWATAAAMTASAPAGSGTGSPSTRTMELQEALALGLGAISWSLGLIAIVWFSIWMGLGSKKIPIAMLKTFWYVKILPGFGVSFCSGLLFFTLTLATLGANSVWLFPVIMQLLYIGVNLALIALARRRAQVAFSKWAEATAL